MSESAGNQTDKIPALTCLDIAILDVCLLHANALHAKSSKARRHPVLSAVAGLLCGLVLLSGILAASREWHQWFHAHDDGDAHASCAACLLASGSLDQPHAELPSLAAPVAEAHGLPVPFSTGPRGAFRMVFRGRGPPAPRA